MGSVAEDAGGAERAKDILLNVCKGSGEEVET